MVNLMTKTLKLLTEKNYGSMNFIFVETLSILSQKEQKHEKTSVMFQFKRIHNAFKEMENETDEKTVRTFSIRSHENIFTSEFTKILNLQ